MPQFELENKAKQNKVVIIYNKSRMGHFQLPKIYDTGKASKAITVTGQKEDLNKKGSLNANFNFIFLLNTGLMYLQTKFTVCRRTTMFGGPGKLMMVLQDGIQQLFAAHQFTEGKQHIQIR